MLLANVHVIWHHLSHVFISLYNCHIPTIFIWNCHMY